MAAATIVHDTSEAVELCPPYGLYLKPITKMTISVALPQLKQPGKSISNWEVMERLKGMVQHHQFSTLHISKSTMDFIRFEGEVENKSLVKSFLACLDGKTIKLSGFSDILKVRAAEFKVDFPTRHDWDSFFRDAKDMNETLPGERPDTIHLEGLPCKWFSLKESGSEKPSEEVLVRVFERFGEIRNVDIPMLDPYREEMTGRNFHTFSFGGHLNFEAYVQYREYAGFIQAMSALRGMKLMFKGEDGKAVACNIKVGSGGWGAGDSKVGSGGWGAGRAAPQGLGHGRAAWGPHAAGAESVSQEAWGQWSALAAPAEMRGAAQHCRGRWPGRWVVKAAGHREWGAPHRRRGEGATLSRAPGQAGLASRRARISGGRGRPGRAGVPSAHFEPCPLVPRSSRSRALGEPALCGESEAGRLLSAGPSACAGQCELVLTLPCLRRCLSIPPNT